jgi:hypothetical protein
MQRLAFVTAVALLVSSAAPAAAQAVITNPGWCAQFLTPTARISARAVCRAWDMDSPDQSGATGMGELFRGGAFQRVLQLHQRLGGEEGQAPSGACSETKGLRLGTME